MLCFHTNSGRGNTEIVAAKRPNPDVLQSRTHTNTGRIRNEQPNTGQIGNPSRISL